MCDSQWRLEDFKSETESAANTTKLRRGRFPLVSHMATNGLLFGSIFGTFGRLEPGEESRSSI